MTSWTLKNPVLLYYFFEVGTRLTDPHGNELHCQFNTHCFDPLTLCASWTSFSIGIASLVNTYQMHVGIADWWYN